MPTIDDDDHEEVLKPQIPNDVPKKEQFGMKIETAVSVKESDIQWKPKSINVDLGNMVFELDALQQELLNRYLRQDQNFLRAFYTNYTELFMTFIRDKARLNEPVTLSIMGQTRCQPKGSQVLMSDGSWKNIENVQIGERVISPQKDGSVIFSPVVGIYKGIDDIYSIYDKKRKTHLYSCSSNHRIPFHRMLKRGRYRLPEGGRAKPFYEWTIDHFTPTEFLAFKESYVHQNALRTLSCPNISSFEGRSDPDIDAYSLGAFLGDGHFTTHKREGTTDSCQLGFTNSNLDVVSRVSSIYPHSKEYPKGNSIQYRWSLKSEFALKLTSFGLKGKKSGDKFIPEKCLYSSQSFRENLLAGLIDTDGYYSKTKNQLEITTKSLKMAEGIKHIVHTLGGYAHISPITKGIKKLGFKGKYYRVNLILRTELPLSIDYKKRISNKYIARTSNQLAVRIKTSGEGEVYGITIDSPSSWYVTDGYMVTHNSGKSTSGITIAGLLMEARGKLMDVEHIQANQFEFMTALKNPDITHFGDCFVIDESKDAVFGVGSSAKKFKLGDIQNIIAVNNISTIWIRPDGWAFDNSLYGLRAFGRGQFYKDGTKAPCRINRFMLYNLQESSAGGSLPLGMIYLPHFTDILKNGEQLWKDYSAKKQAWVDAEQKGESDTLVIDMMNIADKIYNYPKFKLLKGANQKKTFIQTALGSEATKGEIGTIFEMTRLLENGFTLEEIRNMGKMQG